jgi:hypothetical protein
VFRNSYVQALRTGNGEATEKNQPEVGIFITGIVHYLAHIPVQMQRARMANHLLPGGTKSKPREWMQLQLPASVCGSTLLS